MTKGMATPSQGLICCKGCGSTSEPHKAHKLFCVPCTKRKQVEYQRQYRERQKANPKPVTCKGCGKQFDTGRNGRTWRCLECIREYQARDRRNDLKRHAEYSRNYRARLGDEYRRRLVLRRRVAIESMSPDELEAFRQAERDKSKRLSAELRREVFARYGGMVCACCGETEPKFLSIDHINNDGAEMRRKGVHGNGGVAFYQWLRKSGFPDGFQVLCMNCNVGKHRNGGVCPHQARCNDYPRRGSRAERPEAHHAPYGR